MSLLLAYEDRYCRELDRTLRRAVKLVGPLRTPRVFHPVNGVTNFRGFVRRRWPLFRDTGFPTPGKPKQEALICIADADVVAAQLGLTAPKPPYGEWILSAEDEFTALLRRESDQPAQVHGALLRWSLESTLIAAFDEHEAMLRLAGSAWLDETGLADFLARCKPDPREITDDEFVDTFDKPQPCLLKLASHLGWRRLKKGDPRKDAALEWTTTHRLDKLLSRVPDLARIAGRIHAIASTLEP